MPTAEQTVIGFAKELRKLKSEKTALEEKVKEKGKRITELEKRILPELMDENDIKNMKIKGVGTLFTKSEIECGLNVGDQEEGFKFLRANGASSLIKPAVHHATLKSWAKERLEGGKTLPEIFHVWPYRKAQIRK